VITDGRAQRKIADKLHLGAAEAAGRPADLTPLHRSQSVPKDLVTSLNNGFYRRSFA
jgi:hypothetical protein